MSSTEAVTLSSGYLMPIIGLGTWQSSNEEEIESALEAAIDAGYRHIDTAFLYGNEHMIGKTLKKLFEREQVQRSDLFIVSKLPANGMRPENVEYFFRKSLSALQLDYLDLYLVHCPLSLKKTEGTDDIKFDEMEKYLADDKVDLIETWKEMENLVDKNLIRSIGLSNFNSKQIQRIVDNARIKPANLQVECHVYLPQFELQEFCKNLNISFTAYSSLGSPGFVEWVKKNYGMKIEHPSFLSNSILVEIAKKHKKTAAQVALRYIVQRGIIVIPKSVNPKRIRENMEIFDFQLTDEDIAELKTLSNGYRYFNMEDKLGMKEHPEFPFAEAF